MPKPTAPRVFVLDHRGKPLDPCHPARARRLLACGRARVVHHTPLVVRIIDRSAEHSTIHELTVKIDPGSRHTGVVLARVDDAGVTHGLFAVQVDHRGQVIRDRLKARKRYRQQRWDNRARPDGWLAPSVAHRVNSTVAIVARLCRWAPVDGASMELVRFDTQAMENPEIEGVGYQQGTLAGFEIREYLLAKWGHHCAYCGASGVGPKSMPLNIDHVRPRSKGGSDRVSNLVVSCVACNQAKDNRPVEEFLAHDPVRLAQVKAQAKAPLADAAAVNTTRWAIWRELSRMFPGEVSTGTGGRTKWNRTRFGLPKSHTLDAICVGEVDAVACYPSAALVAKASGRGTYVRTKLNAARICRHCGKTWSYPLADQELAEGQLRRTASAKRLRKFCPECRVANAFFDGGYRNAENSIRRIYSRFKSSKGFQTGDLVRAVVPAGKKAGTHVGRVAVRTSGSFNISTAGGVVQGVGCRHCQLLQRADGWGWSTQPEGGHDAA